MNFSNTMSIGDIYILNLGPKRMFENNEFSFIIIDWFRYEIMYRFKLQNKSHGRLFQY